MNTLIHADVFFFITSIAVVLVTAVLVVALIYAARILSDLKSISRRAREESELISKDIADLRAAVKNEGARWGHLVDFFGKLFKRRKSTRKK